MTIKIRPISTDWAVYVPPAAARSLAGFREWCASDDFPEDARICYLAGELYIEMGHERISSHVALKTALAEVLNALARELQAGRFFSDGCQLVDVAADVSAEPDGCYLTWAAVTEGRVKLKKSYDGEDVTELIGPVDMAMEIVSPSSVQKDTSVLPALYYAAGVREYWLIDARKAEVSFDIYRRAEAGFTAVEPVDAEWLPSEVFGREFRLERSRDPIGIWQYTLHVRPLS
jgi:Uma2 family endonuclease